uniref:MTP_lip_bd domain-containing protein n=1 Tax=Steinernema glaseri TaxID=37863 RepID=A0A1I7YR79_9BILA
MLARRFVLFFALLALTWAAEEPVPTEDAKDNAKKPDGIDVSNMKLDASKMPNKTRLLEYEYLYKSHTSLFENSIYSKHKVDVALEAKFKFETLHHDPRGRVLARYELIECVSGPCEGDVPVFYLDYIQGGNNIKGLYAKLNSPDQKITWNVVIAAIYGIYSPAISGAGDRQNVNTPFGLCSFTFGRPEDKRFTRKIDGCHIGGERNQSLVDSAIVHNYKQDVLYIQNTKHDADIVLTEIKEKFEIRSPLHKGFTMFVDARTDLEMMNRTRKYVLRYCPYGTLAGDCATDVFGATFIGSDWREIKKNIDMGLYTPSKFEKAVHVYRNHLYEMGDSETCDKHSKLFGNMVKAAVEANPAELEAALRKPENDIIMTPLAQVIAAVGSVEALNLGKTVLTTEAPDVLIPFVRGLAFTTRISDALNKIVADWRKDVCATEGSEELCAELSFTLATLLRRKCETTTSNLNICNKGKDVMLNEFFDELTSCKDDYCAAQSLKVLANLPLEQSFNYALSFICNPAHNAKVSEAALKLLSIRSVEKIDSSFIKKLVRIFRNVCERESTRTESLLALDILLKAAPLHQTVGTYLLRTETVNPVDQEKWAYFYDAINASRFRSEKTDDYWKRMRNFRIFRPNWAQRSLIAFSNARSTKAAEVGPAKIFFDSREEFESGGLFKRSQFGVDLLFGLNRLSHLFELNLDSTGLAASLGDNEVNTDGEDSEDLSASAQMMLFNHRSPDRVFFEGYSDLMSAVWGADGHTAKLHEDNVVFRHFTNSLPLISGIALKWNTVGVFSMKIFGSMEVSLWNRDSNTDVFTNVSISVDNSFELFNAKGSLGRSAATFGLVGSININTKAEFLEEPYANCITTSHGATQIIRSYNYKNGPNPGMTFTREVVVPGSTFADTGKKTQSCRHFHLKGLDN